MAEEDPELVALRVCTSGVARLIHCLIHAFEKIGLLSLSLRLVSDGLTIDLFSLLRFKDQLVRALGYQDVQIVPSQAGHTFHIAFSEIAGIPDHAYPCISDLMFLLDSPHPFEVPGSVMGIPAFEDDITSSLLVGSLFVDIAIGLFVHIQDIVSLPPTPLKNTVKCLIISLQKHDFESHALRPLQGNLRKAVRRCLIALVKNSNVSHEIRQLALSTCHVFIKRCTSFVGNFI